MALPPNLEEAFARRRARLGDPPTLETLAAYREGRLSEAERERVLEYAAVDPETAEALLDAVRFPDIPPLEDEKPRSTEEREAQWQKLRAELVKAGVLPASEADRREPGWRKWLPMAAAVVIAAGLGVWSGVRHEPPSEPFAGVPSVFLLPEGSAHSRGGGETGALPDEESGWLVVELALEHEGVFERYAVELRDGRGKLLWEGEGTPVERSRFVLILPRAKLQPGRQEIHLFGLDPAGERGLVGRYALRLSSPPD